MIRQNVYRKRPHWATDRGIPVIPTRVPIEIVREGTQTVGPDHAKDTCVDGTVRVCDVLTLQSAEVEAWGKIIFMDASRAHCQADATSEMAIELSLQEQVEGEDLIRKILKSQRGTRKAAHNWERKLQKVPIENNFEIGTWWPALVCCPERKLCGFVHGDDVHNHV